MTLCVYCAYCREAPATEIDHIFSKAEGRRAGISRDDVLWQVPSCHPCNMRKGTLRRLPESMAHMLPEAVELSKGKPWWTWNGDPKTLYSESDKEAYDSAMKLQEETEA